MNKKTTFIAAIAIAIVAALSFNFFSSSSPVVIKDDEGKEVSIGEAKRIITVGNDITEIVYALGAGDRLVATDKGSVFPADAEGKATLGPRRKLSAEGILVTKPDLVLLSRNFGPPEVLDLLRSAGVPVLVLPEGRDRDGIRQKMRLIGKALRAEDKAEELVAKSDQQLDAVAQAFAAIPEEKRKRIVFLHSVAGGKASGAAGGDTPAGLVINLAGGVNALNDMSGYKIASAEALLRGQPDFVLMTKGPEGGRDPNAVFAVPALQGTPALKNRALIQMDASFMLGFGPRTGAAVRELALQLYPELDIPVIK